MQSCKKIVRLILQTPFKPVRLFIAACALVLNLTGKAGAFLNMDYYQAGANEYYCASTTTLPSGTAAGLTAVSPPLILQNPLGSGVKMVLLDTGIEFTASPAAAAGVFLAYNLTTSSSIVSPTAGNITTAYVGLSTGTFVNSRANCYVAGTLPATPTAFRYLGGTTGAAAIGGVSLTEPTSPKVVLSPGAIISVQTTSSALLIGHLHWIELPQ